MSIMHSSIRWALGLVGRLRLAVRLAVVADLDTRISNVSPSAPICGGEAMITSSITTDHRCEEGRPRYRVPTSPVGRATAELTPS